MFFKILCGTIKLNIFIFNNNCVIESEFPGKNFLYKNIYNMYKHIYLYIIYKTCLYKFIYLFFVKLLLNTRKIIIINRKHKK